MATRTRSYLLYGSTIFASLGGFYIAARQLNPYHFAESQNYDIEWAEMAGWKKERPGMQQLFRYSDPESGVSLIGSVSRIVDEVNPTPELDTNGLADNYIAITRANFKGWTAERYPDAGGTVRFSVIFRDGPDRSTWSAFAARGNTTLIVSMGANGTKREVLPSLLPKFREFLSKVEFSPKEFDKY